MKKGYIKKRFKWCDIKKFLKWFGISLGIILIIALIGIGILFGKQIVSLSSLKQINDDAKNYPFYTMTYKGDYGFDDYLQVGSKDVSEYKQIVEKEVGGEINIVTPPNCSSFTAVAPNGDKLFARNLDTTEAIPLFLKTNPSKGYKSMSMVNMSWLGFDIKKLPLPLSKNSCNIFAASYMPLEGMNEHGLAMSCLTASGSASYVKENKISLNDYSIIRMVLDKASTVEEAVEMIRNYNMSFLSTKYPWHYMIADATGASVVVEYVKGELQTVYSDKPYQIVTNFLLYDYPSNGNELFGLDRYQRIEAKLKETEAILTEKEAMKLLSKNTILGDEQWSTVYNLTQKKAFICVGKDYETIYEFALD